MASEMLSPQGAVNPNRSLGDTRLGQFSFGFTVGFCSNHTPAVSIFAARAVCSANKCADQFHVEWWNGKLERHVQLEPRHCA